VLFSMSVKRKVTVPVGKLRLLMGHGQCNMERPLRSRSATVSGIHGHMKGALPHKWDVVGELETD
jgi:hypothetical protein